MSRVLINFSGGLDSTYCLWRLLERGRDVVSHHIVLETSQQRHEHESRAVAAVYGWLRDRGHTFEAIESGFRQGTIPKRQPDASIWLPLTGYVLRSYPDIRKVVVPRLADSFEGMEGLRRRGERERPVADILAKRRIEWVYPVANKTKGDIIEALPPDLRALTWWCRRPSGDGPCHACLTCRQVDRYWPIEDQPHSEVEPAEHEPPPTSGKGSSRDAWVAYARSQGADDIDDLTRAELIARYGDGA